VNLSKHLEHQDKKSIYWANHAIKVLNDPKATQSEVKCAIIGVQSFSPELTKQLKAKKWHKLKES
jgi:hypothetical protein